MPKLITFGCIYQVVLTELLENVRYEVFTAVTIKNVVFWNIKAQFVSHRRHIKSSLQSPAC
jgi:hypothetical protein